MRGGAVAGHEGLEIFVVRKVEAAAAGQEKLAPDRRHAVEHRDPHAVACERLGRDQAGRTPSENSDPRRAQL
jgi:hypothetical protein